MNKKHIFLTTLFLIFTELCFGQWKYPNAKNIKSDVIITYEVKYDRELTEAEKNSIRYKKEIVVIFNENQLLEKTFSNRIDFEMSFLLDYKKELSYSRTRYGSKKEAIKTSFGNPSKKTNLTQETETILGFPCMVSTTKVKGKIRKIYTTKNIGLKFVKQYNTEGFLLKYTANDKYLGPYTVTANKISYVELPSKTYSLNGYIIKTKEEQKEYLETRKKKLEKAKENAAKK